MFSKRGLSTFAHALVFVLLLSASVMAQEGEVPSSSNPVPDAHGEPAQELSWWQSMLRGFWCWLMAQALGMAEAFGTWFGGYVPNELMAAMQQGIGILASLYSLVNPWLPVDAAFLAAGGYYAFAITVIAYRAIKSWIPTLS